MRNPAQPLPQPSPSASKNASLPVFSAPQATASALNAAASNPLPTIPAQDAYGNFAATAATSFANNLQSWQSPGAIGGYSTQGNTLLLTPVQAGQPVPQFTFLTPSMVRMRFNTTGDYSQDHSYALPDAPFQSTVSNLTVKDEGDTLTATAGGLMLVIQKNPYQLTLTDSSTGQTIYQEVPPPAGLGSSGNPGIQYIDKSVVCFRALDPDSRFYGFGEKAGLQLEKSGQTLINFNFDNFEAPESDAQPMYISVPLLLEFNADWSAPNPCAPNGKRPPYCLGLFIDNPAPSYFDCGGRSPGSGTQYSGVLFGDLNTYFIHGTTVEEVTRQYMALTGTMPLPPRYVLGYHQGCYGYLDSSTVKKVVDSYRDNSIPFDGLHLDIVLQDNYSTFTFNQDRYGDPKQFFTSLSNLGVKCSTNITSLINNAPGFAYPSLESGSVSPLVPAGGPVAVDPSSPSQQGGTLFLGDPNQAPVNGVYPAFVGSEDYGTDNFQSSNPPLSASGYYPDLTYPPAQYWWGQQYQDLISAGLEMVWQDMTDPALGAPSGNPPYKTVPLNLVQYDFGRYSPHITLHNAWALTMVKWTYNGITGRAAPTPYPSPSLRPDKRLFIIARGGYAGMQRYAGVWTGDSSSDWSNYQRNIPMVLNLGLSGIAIAGSDIGGFGNGSADVTSPSNLLPSNYVGPTDYVDTELYTRWMTMGAFMPWYRNHYDGYTKLFQEPYRYDQGTLTAVRRAIELRYRLLQYLYDTCRQCSEDGSPVARPMLWNFPTDANTYNALSGGPDPIAFRDRQFMVGDSLLVAPVMQQGLTSTTVYLPSESSPATKWYFFNGDERLHLYVAPYSQVASAYQGGSQYTLFAPPGMVPCFIREGTILPLRTLEQYVGEQKQCPLTFNVYPGADSSYELYLDDGTSFAYADAKAYRLTRINATSTETSRTLTFTREVNNFTPAEPFFYVRVLSETSLKNTTVSVNGQPLAQSGTVEEVKAAQGAGYSFDVNTDTLLIKVLDNSPNITVTVCYS